MKSNCIFCYRPESNSTDLKVCSTCTAKFVTCGRDTLDKIASNRTLTKGQSEFLGVRFVA